MRQTGPIPLREVRADLAVVKALAAEMAEARQLAYRMSGF